MKKSAEAVSIIEGEDEPTSVFIVERKEKNIFKRFGMYLLNRKKLLTNRDNAWLRSPLNHYKQ